MTSLHERLNAVRDKAFNGGLPVRRKYNKEFFDVVGFDGPTHKVKGRGEKWNRILMT